MAEHEQTLRQKEREALRLIATKLGISEEEALHQAIQIMEDRIAVRHKIAARLGLRAAEVEALRGLDAKAPIVPEDEES